MNNGNSYCALGKYYDRLISGYDYESVVEYIKRFATGRGIELGTGTGKIAVALSEAGIETVGVDKSAEMLSQAMQNARAKGQNVVFINEDIAEFEFFPCNFVLAPCDVFNYITDFDELKGVFAKIFSALKKGGMLFFDLSSEYKLKNIVGNNQFFEDYDDITLLWSNSFENQIVKMDISIFEKSKGDCYVRRDESHVQRAYSKEEIENALKEVGFAVEVLGEKLKEVKSEDCRLFFKATK